MIPIELLHQISEHVAEIMLAHYIQEEIFVKRIWHCIFPPITYKNKLVKIINETIIEFDKSHIYDRSDGKFPFYESEIFFEHLSSFVLFEKGTLDVIRGDFKSFPKIILPTQNELDEFYTLFLNKTYTDKILYQIFIDENYKNQIFKITKIVEEIREKLIEIKADTSVSRAILEEWVVEKESKRLTTQKTLDALNQQIERQLKKQIHSGKYLQNTFIETGEQKDHLRYLTDSILYSNKCLEEIRIMDFRHLNDLLKRKNFPKFDLDFEKIIEAHGAINVSNSIQIINDWYEHLVKKRKEIIEINLGSYLKSKFEYKFTDRLEDLQFLKSKVALITETAGQGKTNFLCDFVDNFLLKRATPTLFLTGTQINAEDIRLSILRTVFPNSTEHSFEEFLSNLKDICHEQNKFFVLIIDGINENSKPDLLSQKLESLISELLEFDFIRIIISCRTEYYQQNFLNLENSAFAKEVQKISSLWNRNPDDSLNKKLFDIYICHFKIQYKRISNNAYNQLVSNFLLLRIFCETYQNQTLDFIDDIYKEDLFEKYYSLKSDEINKRLLANDEFKVTGTFDIRNFISNVVEFMIDSEVYANVPLDKIIEDPKDRQMYIRFLDENILVKRDVQIDQKGIFTQDEVVNFTFDEFRDFIVSRYLIEVIYKSSQEKFITIIESQISEKSPLLEGCSTFLFFISRRLSDAPLNSIISKQPWFSLVFSKCIFSLRDSQVTEFDKNMLKENLVTQPRFNNLIIFNLICRYDTKYYKILNIDFLFDSLREFDETQYLNCFQTKFGDRNWGYSEINQETLIDEISDILENRDLKSNPSYHKLFELLIYMFINQKGWEIKRLYERYYFLHNEIGKEQLKKAFQSKNQKLIIELKKFIHAYEIKL